MAVSCACNARISKSVSSPNPRQLSDVEPELWRIQFVFNMIIVEVTHKTVLQTEQAGTFQIHLNSRAALPFSYLICCIISPTQTELMREELRQQQ